MCNTYHQRSHVADPLRGSEVTFYTYCKAFLVVHLAPSRPGGSGGSGVGREYLEPSLPLGS